MWLILSSNVCKDLLALVGCSSVACVLDWRMGPLPCPQAFLTVVRSFRAAPAFFFGGVVFLVLFFHVHVVHSNRFRGFCALACFARFVRV